MTKYSKKSMEEIVSEFIVSTCQLIPKSYVPASDRVYMYLYVRSFCQKPKMHAMDCGSSAEFYIRPMNTLIEDLDTLVWPADELAFAENPPVLPNDVSRLNDTIKCWRIEPYRRYPGFVQLRGLGDMNYDWKYKKYAFRHKALSKEYLQFDFQKSSPTDSTVKGPSISCQNDPTDYKIDNVYSVWCPQWPKEAENWPKRQRDYGWPTIDTISEVVQQGCHVVYVQHRSCRNDANQWRLSFSVAEVILLQSWNKVQQIVYHLLRFFAKKQLIQKDCPKEDEVLCTYHLKTLVLWTCEEMPPEWWNSSSVIAICCELLRKLSECLKQGHCPNYFIPKANLFYKPSRSTILKKTERQLNEYLHSGELCLWFVKSYILPITGNFDITAKINLKLLDFMLLLFDYRKGNIVNSLNILFMFAFIYYGISYLDPMKCQDEYLPISHFGHIYSLRHFKLLTHSTMWLLPIPENISCFRYFDRTMYILHARNGLECGEMLWNGELFVEYIKNSSFTHAIVKCQYHIFPKTTPRARSQFRFLQAQNFMETLTGLNTVSGPSTFQLLSFMSKEILREALECDDGQTKCITSAALVYLGALHFATLENQTVIELCFAVLMDQTSQIENETLNAGCLFFIDDVVRIVGLSLLCKKICEKIMFWQRQIVYLDLRLSPKGFAYYLAVKSAERMTKQFELNLYLPTSTFTLDEFLLVLVNRNYSTSRKTSICLRAARECVYRRTDPMITIIQALSMDPVRLTDKVLEYLTGYAFENMTLFYKEIRRNCDIQGNTVDCYRALYLYKCRKYGEVLILCEQILQNSCLEKDLKELLFANVLVLPPFDSFFDRDVLSLLGFNTLFCCLSPLLCESRNETLFTYFYSRFVFSQDRDMALSFGLYNPHKCHFFIGRHFLASYLKVRCCIDCSHPLIHALAEFAAMKIVFPFEYIIRQFVLRKLAYVRNNLIVSSLNRCCF